ncbi:MAG: hypothetical protein GY880_28030 [Planctomycetaceae bacterium]|nr:hypothetical protein [Planctomycetaceae bacterium]
MKRVPRDDSMAGWGINGYAFADWTVGLLLFKLLILAAFSPPRKPHDFLCHLCLSETTQTGNDSSY